MHTTQILRFIALVGIGISTGCSTPAPSTLSKTFNNPKPASVTSSRRELVVSYQPLATEIGNTILDQGGNAFDAFVASTAAQYVLAPGVTSFAGPLGALLYNAESKEVVYLDATFNDPLESKHKWDAKNPQFGSAALIPGAVAGLEAISKKYGKLPFRAALEPAAKLAENGFPLNAEYANLLLSDYGKNLKRSPYAQKTYFHSDGSPFKKGEVLKLPVVAGFIRKIASQGSRYVYSGKWAGNFLKAVNAQGGHLTKKDFTTYKPRWRKAALIEYRGFKIYSPVNNGAAQTLLALKVLEHADLARYGAHYTQTPEGLATLTLIYSEVAKELWLQDNDKVTDEKFVQQKLSDSTAQQIWDRVQKMTSTAAPLSEGSHSYHTVIIDQYGNAITGTNTIESFPWGDDIFVEGIPLTASNALPFATRPGERRQNAFSMQIGFQNEKLKFAVGAFSASLVPAEFQFLVNIMDYKLSAADVMSKPRFGTAAWDFKTLQPTSGFWLDSDVDKTIVQTLAERGLKFTQDGYVDVGLGSVAIVEDDGQIEGAIAPMPGALRSGQKIIGIGVALDEHPTGEIYINSVFPGSPAEIAGLKSGDIITAIKTDASNEFVSVTGKTMADVMKLMKGPAGSLLTLMIKRNDETLTILASRAELIQQD